MRKKKQDYLYQKKYLYYQKLKLQNIIYSKSFKTNFELNNFLRLSFFITNRKKEEWHSHKTLICPYTFSPRVPNKNFGFSRFYYVKYTTFLSNSALRQL
uniref:Uncharacterized protein n=1 Tax=Thuricola similis TaxID=2784598 RepID=A0A7T8JK32_9CILI|nr:hypothetical protein K4Z05_mgp12 [Thuricola similis]QQP22151.1 hypothetical protein TSIM_44 [Thuricola similis]